MIGAVPSERAVVLDTNIVIDRLQDEPAAVSLLTALSDVAVSVVTRVEILGGAKSPIAERSARALLASLVELSLDEETVEFAIQLRRLSRMNLGGRTGVIVPYRL